MKETLNDLLSRGKIQQVLDKLLALDEKLDEDLNNTILILSIRHSNYLKNNNLGLISSEESKVELANINKSIIYVIQELPAELSSTRNQSKPIKQLIKRNTSWIAILPLTFLFLVVAWAVITNQHKESNNKYSSKIIITDTSTSSDSTVIPKSTEKELTSIEFVPLSKSTQVQPSANIYSSLVIDTNNKQFINLFRSQAIKIMEKHGMIYQKLENTKGKEITFNFELQEEPTISGFVDAIEYSIGVEIVIQKLSQAPCETKYYHSNEPQIGYEEDSKNAIKEKVILPLLENIERQIQSEPPKFCKKS